MNNVKESKKTIEERIKELESQVEVLTYIKYKYYFFGCFYFFILFALGSFLIGTVWLFLFSIIYFGIIFFGEIIFKGVRFLFKQNNNNPLSNDGEEK